VLRQVAKVLEGKSGKRPPDDIAKIRAAHSKAKAVLGTDADNPYHAKLGNIAVSLMAPRVLALSPLTPICSRPGARALLGFAKG
jgi:hypothetical protein